MKVTSSRTLAACQGSAGVSGVCGDMRVQVVDDDLAFAQRALFGADERNLAQRRRGQHRLVLRLGHDPFFAEGDALFEQHHLHLVVVVRHRKAAQCDHACLLGVVGWQ